MIQHNLTIAFRNLWKYKLQTIISIASIAIGIVTLALVHGLLQRHLRPACITTMPYYDRVCILHLDSILKVDTLSVDKTTYYVGDRVRVNADIMRAMTDGGGLRCIEMGPTTAAGMQLMRDVNYTMGDTLTRKYTTAVASAGAAYPHFAGYRSAITGERIAVMRLNECIIAESMAKKIFGEVNPVGVHVQFYNNEDNISRTIVDVYQDVSERELGITNALMFTATDYDVWYNYAEWQYVLLKPGCTLQQLEAEVNERMEPLGLRANAFYLKKYQSGEDKITMRIHFFAYLFGSLILLAAGIGFLRMQTQLLWMRKREISLRVVHGATHGQLFA